MDQRQQNLNLLAETAFLESICTCPRRLTEDYGKMCPLLQVDNLDTGMPVTLIY